MAASNQIMEKIVQDLASRDKRFAKVVDAHPLCTIGSKPSTTSNFETLVESVVSQQLSVKAADTIYSRLMVLVKNEPTPRKIAKLSEISMRECGISGPKIKAIKGLAEASISKTIDFEKLHLLEQDEHISTQLNSLWGIGPWTVDMFMMQKLGRLDIWPTGDLGVRRGWERIYGLKEQIDPKELHLKGEIFRPYRSVVAWYCWRAADG